MHDYAALFLRSPVYMGHTVLYKILKGMLGKLHYFLGVTGTWDTRSLAQSFLRAVCYWCMPHISIWSYFHNVPLPP